MASFGLASWLAGDQNKMPTPGKSSAKSATSFLPADRRPKMKDTELVLPPFMSQQGRRVKRLGPRPMPR